MADEIAVTINATVTNGELDDRAQLGTKRFDQSTAKAIEATPTLTSDSTTLYVGDIANSMGWCIATNLSTATTIIIGPSSGYDFVRLFPTATAAFPLASTQITGKTVTGTADLNYRVWST